MTKLLRDAKGHFVKAEVAKRGRGRPPVYKGQDKIHILSLIRKHGLTGAQRVLTEEKKQVPTLPMLVRWAKEADIAFSGRHPSLEDKDKVVKLLRKYHSHKKVKEVLVENCPTYPTLVKWAAEADIKIKRSRRGRPTLEVAAA